MRRIVDNTRLWLGSLVLVVVGLFAVLASSGPKLIGVVLIALGVLLGAYSAVVGLMPGKQPGEDVVKSSADVEDESTGDVI